MWLRCITLFKQIKAYALLLFYAFRHPETPQYIRRLIMLTGLYVISPIDLVPDYLPLVGLVDDVLVLPTAVYLLTNLLPTAVKRQCEASARRAEKKLPYLFALAALLAAAWLSFIGWVLYRAFFSEA